ncbi:acyl-CoA thioesterase [Pseudocnuella soli]|uniref:acyl-CoA thioesterase n=1 Tax=Pseudocnuella soli TaxID=2502779 RepID=UPI00104A1686|nr:thioesterase family protein [Pseudocnuella soli]
MARIKIDLPQSFSFFTEIPVRITDLNYGGHVGNDTILSMMHEARMRFLQHHGLAELNPDSASLIMSDVAIQYKLELFYGDKLKVYVTAFDFGRVGFDLAYKLVKNEGEEVVALAKTGMVCFNYQQRKTVAVPQLFIDKLSGSE